jgi:hypothetical protein
MEKVNMYYWGNIEVQILKRYVVFNKAKISEVFSKKTHIVDLSTLKKTKESTIIVPMEWLEE